MNLMLLQHESECQPSFMRDDRREMLMLHVRQFSSADGRGRSIQPKSGTCKIRQRQFSSVSIYCKNPWLLNTVLYSRSRPHGLSLIKEERFDYFISIC